MVSVVYFLIIFFFIFLHGFRRRRKRFLFFFFTVSVVFFYGFRRGRKIICMVSVAGFSMDSAVAGGFNILERIEWFLVFWLLGLVSVAVFILFLWFPSWQENVFFFFMVSVVGFLWFPSWQGTFSFYGFRRWFSVSCSFSFLFYFCGFRLLQDRGSLSDGNHNKTIRTFPWRTKYIYN